jgi:hypothetical protein
MLIAPSSTGRYFAWPLGPRALAARVGGFYVVSAPALIAYGIGGLPVAALHPDALGPGAAGYVAGLLIVVAVPALALARGARG